MKGTFQNVQALRGIACMMVMIFHLAINEQALGLGFNPLSFVRWFGYAGVDLFFVISGFIIATSNAQYLGQTNRVPGYLIRRFWRVVPPYWIWFFLVAFPLITFGVFQLDNRASKILTAACLLPGGDNNPWIPPAWTLTHELAFYLAFAVIISLPRLMGNLALIGWVVVLAMQQTIGVVTPTPWTELWTGPYVFEFLLGIAVAKMNLQNGPRFATIVAIFGVVWLAIALFVTFDVNYQIMPSNTLLRVVVFGAPCACAVLAAIQFEQEGSIVRNRFLLMTGNASYSVYLTHSIVLLVSFRITSELGWSHSRLSHLVWLMMIMSAMIAVGIWYHRRVEKPLLHWLSVRLATHQSGSNWLSQIWTRLRTIRFVRM